MSDARPWNNYAQYRPLVELAKAAELPVVAANAPRRYVSAAGRVGPEVLSQRQWAVGVRAYLPPLPLPQPSAAYSARLLRDPEVAPRKAPVSGGELSVVASSGGCPHIGLRGEDGLLAPMLLWDATMAHAIATALGAARLVVHVCGRDHCLGIAEMLRRHYCPTAVPLTVAFYPEMDLQTFDAARHAGVGDFVVLTDETCN